MANNSGNKNGWWKKPIVSVSPVLRDSVDALNANLELNRCNLLLHAMNKRIGEPYVDPIYSPTWQKHGRLSCTRRGRQVY